MKPITLNLNISEIIYDIQNKTYLTGRSIGTGVNHEHVAHIQANDDDENASQILRSVTMAYSMLRNRLAEYLDSGTATADNTSLKETDDLQLQLKLPSNFNSGVTATIGEAAHQFIVATAVADWFDITAKGETADYNVAAAKSLQVLEEALCKRVRPVRDS